MKLSNQAMGAIMLALQKCLLEQSDIVEIIGNFNFQLNENEELIVHDPPVVSYDEPETDDDDADNMTREDLTAIGSD